MKYIFLNEEMNKRKKQKELEAQERLKKFKGVKNERIENKEL